MASACAPAVHNARQIVPPTASGVPDTLCGVELLGPAHLAKPISFSECALPGSFFEPTVYDYTCEWELVAEHLDNSRALTFEVAICYETESESKSAFGGVTMMNGALGREFSPCFSCQSLTASRVIE